MAEADLGGLIADTQASLGKIIKRPPMTEKLLKKPPFRFLHDLVNEVCKTTGFFEGLYTAQEKVSDNVKEKQLKIDFLQKAIDVTAIALGEGARARPSKIVAGHDPEGTNVWLQAIARAVNGDVDSADAVSRVLAGEKPSSKTTKEKSSSSRDKSASSSRDKSASSSRDKGASSSRDKSASSSRDKSASSSRDKSASSSRDKSASSSRDKSASSSRDKSAKGKDGERERSARKSGSARDKSSREGSARAKSPRERTTRDGSARSGREGSARSGRDGSARERSSRDGSARERSSRDRSARDGSGRDRSSRDKDRPSRHDDHLKPSDADRKSSGRRRDDDRDLEERHDDGHDGQQQDQQQPEQAPPQPAPTEPTPETQQQPDFGETDLDARPPKKADPEAGDQQDDADGPPARPSTARGSRRSRRDEPEAALEAAPADPPKANEDEVAPLPGGVQKAVRLARPSSARPAPPRSRKKALLEADGGSDSRAGSAVDRVQPVVQIQAEGDGADDDDDTFVVVQSSQPETAVLEDGDNEEHGALMRKIMEKKAGDEGGDGDKPDAEGALSREATEKEINSLRAAIQTLCRNANPLGKTLDYMQEDVDSMRKELDTWREENETHSIALADEASITDNALQPLQAKLSDIEQEIADQESMIRAAKTKIHENDAQVQRMLASVAFAAKS